MHVLPCLVSFGAILMLLHGCACLESPVLSDAAQRLPLLAATSCHIFPREFVTAFGDGLLVSPPSHPISTTGLQNADT